MLKNMLTIILNSILFSYSAHAIPPKDLDTFIKELELQTSKLQGGAIAIIHKGEVVYKKTFGYEKGTTSPVTSHSLFPLASVSKPVSAMAVALLVNNGSFSFDEKFKLPHLKNQTSLINILGHTTGYEFSGNAQIEQGLSRQLILSKLKQQKASCPPGKCYFYSNACFSLVEEALNTKKSSLQRAINNLRSKLKTDGMQLVPVNSKFSIAYPHEKGGTLPLPSHYPKVVPASAGIFASLDGMIEFFKLSFGYKPDLINQKILNYMHRPIIHADDINKWEAILPGALPFNLNEIDSYYGIGWRILKYKPFPNKEFIFHGGYIKGIGTFIGYIPSEQMGIIILVNQKTSFATRNGLKFWKEVIKL